ncbi:MAG TPA: O-antigen ligase domain-containing protein, partial [Ghiorsea sp.]|nr:O-antigen ligase domain-containing protein [Ghiorsea sp.]
AILALLQYPNDATSIFYLGMERVGHSGQGTYFNRDHFAALMEMSLPFSIALLAYNFASSRYSAKSVFNMSVIFFALTLLLLIAAIFTKSRSGVALVLLGVFLSTIVFSSHIGGRQTAGFSVVFTGLAIGLGTSIGLIPVLNRFISADPLKDARKEIFESSIVGIQQFWPFGSGSGTFPQVYRGFQPIDRAGFVNHVHNDYLELLFEVGVFALIGFIFYIALYIYRLWKLRSKRWTQKKFIQVAAGIGIFLILLHSLTDFNLHIPANLIFFAFLNGVFFYSAKDRPSV